MVILLNLGWSLLWGGLGSNLGRTVKEECTPLADAHFFSMGHHPPSGLDLLILYEALAFFFLLIVFFF
jgi:hypothetical protein